MKNILLPITGVLVTVAVWCIGYLMNGANSLLLPSPVETMSELVNLFLHGKIAEDLLASIARMFVGYLLAIVIGVPIGLIIGLISNIYRAVYFLLDFFRSIPVTTLYPIFILFFGIGDLSKILMVTVASIFVIILNTAYGTWHVHQSKKQLLSLYGASFSQTVSLVVFPGSIPQIFIGLRIALSYSLIVIVVCEMFMGSNTGIGQRVFDAYNKYSIPELYALIILIGIIGFILNLLLSVLENKYSYNAGAAL